MTFKKVLCVGTFPISLLRNELSKDAFLAANLREGDDIGLFITLVPKVL